MILMVTSVVFEPIQEGSHHPGAGSMSAGPAYIPRARLKNDAQAINLWLHGKSKRTVTAYCKQIDHFLDWIQHKPLRFTTLVDLQAYRTTWLISVSGRQARMHTSCRWGPCSALPPANLKYFWSKSPKKRFAGLIVNEAYVLPPPSLPGPALTCSMILPVKHIACVLQVSAGQSRAKQFYLFGIVVSDQACPGPRSGACPGESRGQG